MGCRGSAAYLLQVAAAVVATTGKAAAQPVPKFAVFFSDAMAIGVSRVEAGTPEAAEALVLEQHPGGSVKAVGDEQVTADNRARMLAAWMRREG